jgi:hypothetical protein
VDSCTVLLIKPYRLVVAPIVSALQSQLQKAYAILWYQCIVSSSRLFAAVPHRKVVVLLMTVSFLLVMRSHVRDL